VKCRGVAAVPPTNLCVPLYLYLQERLKALAAMAEAKRSSATSAQTIAARQAAAEAAAKWKHGDSARVLFLSFELPAGERASPVRVVSTPALCYAIQYRSPRVTSVGVGLMSGVAHTVSCARARALVLQHDRCSRASSDTSVGWFCAVGH
jgi:hypothetical protein